MIPRLRVTCDQDRETQLYRRMRGARGWIELAAKLEAARHRAVGEA